MAASLVDRINRTNIIEPQERILYCFLGEV